MQGKGLIMQGHPSNITDTSQENFFLKRRILMALEPFFKNVGMILVKLETIAILIFMLAWPSSSSSAWPGIDNLRNENNNLPPSSSVAPS